MRSRNLLRAFALAGMVAVPGVALAQDGPAGQGTPQQTPEGGPPFRPTNEQLDRELDRSLHQEYDEDHPPPAPPPPPTVTTQRDDDRGIKLRLGGLAAHYYTQLQDVRISYREGASGGDRIDVDKDD